MISNSEAEIHSNAKIFYSGELEFLFVDRIVTFPRKKIELLFADSILLK